MFVAARPGSMRRASPVKARVTAGFTLIELMVTVTVLGLLLAVAAPSFGAWIRNARVRTVTQGLQDGLRLAQTEAMRRNRMVVFSLTNGTPGPNSTASAAANGSNWMIHTVPLLGFEANEYVSGGALADQAGGVAINGPAAICFNTAGRLSASASTGVSGATCTVNALALPAYNVSSSSATVSGVDRPLRITVSLGGQLHNCDPARTLSAAAADGCP